MSPTGNRTAGSNFHSLQFVQHGDFANVRCIIWVEMSWSHLALQPCLLHAQLHPHQVLDSVYCKWFRGHGKTPPWCWHILKRPKVYTYIVFTPNKGTYNFLIFAKLYGLQEDNIGQSLWDKVGCYWQHAWKHIGSLGNILGTELGTWVTYWELDGNTLGTKNSKNMNTPLSFTRGKKMDILSVCCNSSLVEQNFYY
jgi:hypothetical protein